MGMVKSMHLLPRLSRGEQAALRIWMRDIVRPRKVRRNLISRAWHPRISLVHIAQIGVPCLLMSLDHIHRRQATSMSPSDFANDRLFLKNCFT